MQVEQVGEVGEQAADRVGEQAAGMLLELQVGLPFVTCRVVGPGGGNVGKTTHPTARRHHPGKSQVPTEV